VLARCETWHYRTLTIGATNNDLESPAITIDRTTVLAFVDDLGGIEGGAIETTHHKRVGSGVGAASSRLHAGVALEVDVNWRRNVSCCCGNRVQQCHLQASQPRAASHCWAQAETSYVSSST
jgi:hypothetical protein